MLLLQLLWATSVLAAEPTAQCSTYRRAVHHSNSQTQGLAPTEDVAHLASQQLLSEETHAAARAAAKKAKKDKQKAKKQQQQQQASQPTDLQPVHPASLPLDAALGSLAVQDSSDASTAASFNSATRLPSQGAQQAVKGKQPEEDDLQAMLQAFAAQRALS